MNWVLGNLDLIGEQLLAHLGQALPPIVLSLLLALPIAKVASGWSALRGTISVGSGLLYAVPSLPLFIVLPLLLGTGIRSPLNIIVALTLYGLALMVPSTLGAFRAVPSDALGAATAQGFTPLSRFLTVELPLAGPSLLAGLRVVTVSTVSLVTVGGVLGVPSLGLLFIDGFQRNVTAEILTGIVLTAALALLLDGLLVLLGRVLMPWTRSPRHQSSSDTDTSTDTDTDNDSEPAARAATATEGRA